MRNLVPTTHPEVESIAPIPAARPWATRRVFDRWPGEFWQASRPLAPETNGAPMDVTELDECIRVAVEVPGIDPNELSISLVGQVLTLSAPKRDGYEQTGQPARAERQFGHLRRTVKLPCPVEANEVRAEHKHGVVTITLPKSESMRPKRIRVEVA